MSWFDWDSADHGSARVHAPARRRCAASTRCSAGAAGSRAGRSARTRKGPALPDIAWLTPDGDEMTDEHWDVAHASRSLQVFLERRTASSCPTIAASTILDDSFLVDVPRAPRAAARSSCPSARWGASVDAGARHRARLRRRRRSEATPRARDHGGRALAVGAAPGDLTMIEPRATYRLQLHAGVHVRRCARPRSRTSPSSASATCTCRRSCRRRRARRTATTSSIPIGSATSSAARRAFAQLVEAARRARDSASCSTSCPNHMSIAGSATAGGSTCSRTDRRATTRTTSTSTGPRATTACCCRCSASATAARSQSGVTRVVELGGGKVSGPRAATCELPIAPRSLGTIVERAGGPLHEHRARVHRRCARARCRRRTTRETAKRAGAAIATRPCCSAARRAVASRAAVRASRSPTRSPRSTPIPSSSTRCSSSRTTGSRTGASPASQLSYRRFFDINTLVGLRNEEPDVFDAVPRAACCDWLDDGAIDGVRIDHVDGLREPEGVPDAAARRARRTHGSSSRRSSLPTRHCPRAGRSTAPPATTSCETIGGLFVDPTSERAMTETFEQLHRRDVAIRRARAGARDSR